MAFEAILGNDSIKKALTQMVERDRVPNSLLLSGDLDSECRAFAYELAKLLLNKANIDSHPDLFQYHPEGKVGMHSIEALRLLSHEVYNPPYSAKWKVFIIHDAERMQAPSANALLKTFEEPYKTSVILLLSNHPEKLLPTVRSRCQQFHFYAPRSALKPDSHLIEVLSQGGFRSYQEMKEKIQLWCRELEANEEEGNALQTKVQVERFLNTIYFWYRDLQLLLVKGPEDLLFLKDHLTEETQAMQRGELKPLEEVEEAINTARLSFERFMPLSNSLESLFLKLSWI